jgi:hypothetical protein
VWHSGDVSQGREHHRSPAKSAGGVRNRPPIGASEASRIPVPGAFVLPLPGTARRQTSLSRRGRKPPAASQSDCLRLPQAASKSTGSNQGRIRVIGSDCLRLPPTASDCLLQQVRAGPIHISPGQSGGAEKPGVQADSSALYASDLRVYNTDQSDFTLGYSPTGSFRWLTCGFSRDEFPGCPPRLCTGCALIRPCERGQITSRVRGLRQSPASSSAVAVGRKGSPGGPLPCLPGSAQVLATVDRQPAGAPEDGVIVTAPPRSARSHRPRRRAARYQAGLVPQS